VAFLSLQLLTHSYLFLSPDIVHLFYLLIFVHYLAFQLFSIQVLLPFAIILGLHLIYDQNALFQLFSIQVLLSFAIILDLNLIYDQNVPLSICFQAFFPIILILLYLILMMTFFDYFSTIKPRLSNRHCSLLR
jgi:hypothetical protein